MKERRNSMKRTWIWTMMLAAACCWAGGGCGGDDSEETAYHPAVDVNGKWDVRLDGDPLGVMTLAVSDKGALDGSLTTTQGAEAELAGVMDEYDAEFTMTFPAEAYLGRVTFAGDASSASGALVDNKGFTRVLAMTPRFID